MYEKSQHVKHVVSDRLCYFKGHEEHKAKGFADEISHSLRQTPKFISPKFFYDQKGSELFEKICGLSEYYLTRTEIEILIRIKPELGQFLDGRYRLVELGSGSSTKTRHILDAMLQSQQGIEYMPIDISDLLEQSTLDLIRDYPDLRITGVIDTYENGLALAKSAGCRNLVVFFGSSFGNLSFERGLDFLGTVHRCMGPDDLFLMGLDLVKDRTVLERAYDDSRGITAQFNLNVLQRINDELGGNFNLDDFAHYCTYDDKKQRIEMHLRSLKNQSVSIPKAGMSVSFKKGELIHTESSHKYTIPKINTLMQMAGFRMLCTWQDPDKKFALVLVSGVGGASKP